LNDRDVNALSSPDLADRINRQIEERRQMLSAVDQHKCIRPSSGNQESGCDSFSERSARAKDAFVVLENLCHRVIIGSARF